jgi:Fur family transcriptional regulator, ferric uptake regulator
MSQAADLVWTSQREAVRKIVEKSAIPLSIEDVYVRGRGDFDRATAFRTMKTFHRAGLVTECSTRAGMKTYEWSIGQRHHHHVVCLQCEKMSDVVVREDAILKQVVPAKHGFASITGHTIEFFGICKSCDPS